MADWTCSDVHWFSASWLVHWLSALTGLSGQATANGVDGYCKQWDIAFVSHVVLLLVYKQGVGSYFPLFLVSFCSSIVSGFRLDGVDAV